MDVGNAHLDYDAQKSFINGIEVPYGTKGSSRPDYYKSGSSIEVKNYNITTSKGQNSVINNVTKQVNRRMTDLPNGTVQTIILDVRGQNVTNETLKTISEAINKKSNTNVKIQFKR